MERHRCVSAVSEYSEAYSLSEFLKSPPIKELPWYALMSISVYLIPMNLAWDGVKSDREITIREMLYEDPRKVLRKHRKEKLRSLFLEYVHRFDKRNKSFWKLILEVSDEEYERAIRENFREANKVWDY